MMNYLYTALSGVIVSFTLAVIFIAIFRFRRIDDPSLMLKRATHDNPTSRLGGLAVCISAVFAIWLGSGQLQFYIFLAALPIFVAGLLEDMRYPLPPKLRLLLGAISAGIFIGFEGVWIQGVDVPALDIILAVSPIGWLFTAFCIVALINAVNFIDGINGLASGKSLVVAFAIGALAIEYNEPNILMLAVALFSATLGLFMLNFPAGRIFMGDAGAYTLGFLFAVALITIQHKHPEISPWAIVLIIFWPLADMAHSILRRRLTKKRSDKPDMMHMHHVVMRSLAVLSGGRLSRREANPAATAVILPLSLLPVVAGYIARENTIACIVLFGVFLLAFAGLYAGLVRLSNKRGGESAVLSKLIHACL